MALSHSLATISAIAVLFVVGRVDAQHGADGVRVVVDNSAAATLDALVTEANLLLDSAKLDEYRAKRLEVETAYREATARLKQQDAIDEKQKQLNASLARLNSPQVKIQAILAEANNLDDEAIQAACTKVHAETVQAAKGEERPGVYMLDSGMATRLIAAVEKRSQVQVLSRPSILAVDGQVAEITIGQLVAQAAETLMTPEGKAEVIAIDQNVGLMVSVVPTVQQNHGTQLGLNVKSSSLTGKTVSAIDKASGKAVSAPVIDATRTQATLQASEGKSVLVAIKGKPSDKWLQPTKTTLVLLTPRVVERTADAGELLHH